MSDLIIRNDDNIDVGARRGGLAGAFGSLGRLQTTDIVPPLLGGVASFGSTLLVRRFGTKYPSLYTWAPMIGAGVGVLASVPLYWARGFGSKAVISGSVTSIVTGLGLWAFEKISATNWMAGGTKGIHYASRRRQMAGRGLGATHIVQGSPGARALPTSAVPRPAASAMDVTAFGATPT